MRIIKLSMKWVMGLAVAMVAIGVVGLVGVTDIWSSAGEPGAPQELTVSQNDDGVVLTWSAPAGEVTGYRILRKKPKECEKRLLAHVANTGNTATTYTDEDVHHGVRYVYKVQAINDEGVGKRSNRVALKYRTANTRSQGAPKSPRNLDSEMTREGIRLEWDAPRGNAEVEGYQILRKRPQECEKAFRIHVEDTGNTDTVFIDDDYELNTKYVYRVKAINANGVSRWSNDTRITSSEVQIVMIVAKGRSSIMPGGQDYMTIALSHLQKDSDPATVEYVLRGDVIQVDGDSVTDVNACEGSNLGQDINITAVDEVTVQYDATYGGSSCTEEGEYTVRIVLSDGGGTQLLTMDIEYEVNEAETLVIE